MVTGSFAVKEKAGRQLVLLVDDDAVVRRALQLLLRANDYDVLAYAAARDLLLDPAAREAGCLVTGYLMPDVDGLELVLQLRKAGWNRPAILLCPGVSDDLAQRVQVLGFDCILAKPLQPRLILEAVARAMTGQPPADLP